MTEGDVRQFFAAVSTGELGVLEDALAPSVVLEFPGTRFGCRFEGRRKVLIFFRRNRKLFRDGLRFDVDWVGLVGDRAVAQWTNAGVTQEGRAYANRGATIFRISGGQIVEIQDYLDTELVSQAWPTDSSD